MTTGLVDRPPAASAAAPVDIPDLARVGLMVGILLVMLVGADPFHDGMAAENAESGAGGNAVTQILYLAMGAGAGALILRRGLAVLRPLITVPILAMAAWLCVVTLTSIDPMVSARRLISLGIMMGGAVALLIVARDVRQFAIVLGATALGILLLCYFGLVALPDRAIHTAFDLVEPEHAGSWRGLYAHKNGAGAVMAVFLYIGLFCARAGGGIAGRMVGIALAVLAVVFLAFTNSKTSIALAPVALVLSWLCTLLASGVWRRLVLLGPLAVLLAATIGSVLVPPLGDLIARVAGDPTFTGRTEIWQFAADNIARRPITGFGYGAFWENVFYGGGGDAQTWVNKATDAHNGYLNTALESGVPGLLLTLWWLVLAPIADLQKRAASARLDPLTLLFLRIWLFGIMGAGFETIFYHATNGLFFLITASVFGLRYLASTDALGAPRQRT